MQLLPNSNPAIFKEPASPVKNTAQGFDYLSLSLWCYLTGVQGLLLRRLGDRNLGWKENPSLILSNTEGAT